MISTIEIHGPATFTIPAKLTTDKKINLIYGLNGTGKSTVCRFLKCLDDPDFSRCSVSPVPHPSIYVYNEQFVQENFYESDTFKGIFSLSKENKDAETRIASAKEKKADLSAKKLSLEIKRADKAAELLRAKQIAEDATWGIKTTQAGGDRVLEYCLEGLKGKKETLLNYVLALEKPANQPSYDTKDLKQEAQALSGDDSSAARRFTSLPFDASKIEKDVIFETPIIGSQHTTVSSLIQKLGNSDWVREGLRFISESSSGNPVQCPFCQAETVTTELAQQIRDFFDESYEKNLGIVRDYVATYQNYADLVPHSDDFKNHPFATDRLLLLIEQLRSLIEENLRRIDSKLKSPSTEIVLVGSNTFVSDLNEEIDSINQKIDSYNDKLKNKTKALDDIKTRFWQLMRWEHDSVVNRLIEDNAQISSAAGSIDSDLASISSLIRAVDLELDEAQKGTVNIDEAVKNINDALVSLGIDDFSIEKHDEILYRLQRANSQGSNKFSTLSEGEKMIITLLYFCEFCKGRTSSTDTIDEKIVVFDDPISSLSHIYVFNVGQLIKSTFFQTKVAKQVFVFTHSLYFFYELAKPKKRGQQDTEEQALFRITKSNGQSQFVGMKYDEIQNDYQAYWQVVNDSSQHPALIANCMRNIIDYFFGFVEKMEFTNVFQKAALKDNRFQAFCRYMNRESHSFGQNIYDLKEFDYEAFKDGLRLVFEETSYGEHYSRMSKI